MVTKLCGPHRQQVHHPKKRKDRKEILPFPPSRLLAAPGALQEGKKERKGWGGGIIKGAACSLWGSKVKKSQSGVRWPELVTVTYGNRTYLVVAHV